MRILYVCDALAIHGGLERVLTEKANWLATHGNSDVHILTANQGNHPVCFPLHPKVQFVDLGISFHRLYQQPIWKRLVCNSHLHRRFRERLKDEIDKITPDIMICTRIDYLRDIVKVKERLPLVFESHSTCLASRFDGDGLLRRLHVRYLQQAVKKVQTVVALTEGDAAEWRQLTPHVSVIPNVVHLNDSGIYSDSTAKSVIFVGRFSKQKDVGSLLRIWTQVHHHHPDWQLQIYGGYGDEYEKWNAALRQTDLNIVVHASTSEIMEKYRENSILLMTSQYEPFGLVLPEAMSCGLPVVAFDCPYGPRSIITDGVDGYLIGNRNVGEFAEKVCKLIDNPDLRVKMGKAGVVTSKRFDMSHVMPHWKQFFSQMEKQK